MTCPLTLRLCGALTCMLLAALCAGCATDPAPAVQMPLTAAPLPQPRNVERVVTGSLYQPGRPSALLFSKQELPHAIGDTLKVDIAESLEVESRHKTSIDRANKVATKGPGTSSASGESGGLLQGLLNLDASASGSDSFDGRGEAQAGHKLTTRLTATVVNVLANGNLVVAAERVVRLTNGATTMRFSGVVSPADIRAGNIVASGDVADARLEAVGSGELGESARRGWLQRLLTDTLRVW